MKRLFVILSLFLLYGISPAQEGFTEIGTTYVDYATAYSNGHKIVPVYNEDTIYTVYSYNEDTVYFASSYNRGETWQKGPLYATLWGNAHCPSIDAYASMLFIVSRGDSGGIGEIFLKCPFNWCVPLRVSNTAGHSTLPSIVIDGNFNIHIVWQENLNGDWEIYYACVDGPSQTVGEVLNLSDNQYVSDLYPSIGIYNGDEVYVVWERYDPTIYCPYSIVHRYLSDGDWSPIEFLVECTGTPHHHPSLDFSHGGDELSAAWEDSSLGKSDAYFYGGNGGYWPTPGDSRYPVVSTMGNIWSYVYWEDNSDGVKDIYGRNFYFMSGGWSSPYKFRDVSGDEDMQYPSVANCHVIWTQGDSPPYRVMYCYEGYPIGVEEKPQVLTSSLRLNAHPNPFRGKTVISYRLSVIGENPEPITDYLLPITISIYDLSGRLISTLPITDYLSPITEVVWDGRDNKGNKVKSGVYFCRLEVEDYKETKKLIFLR